MVVSTWTCVCGASNAGPSPCSRCLTPAPWHVASADVVPPPPRHQRWIVPLAIVVAVLVVAGGLAVGIVGGGRDGDRRVDAGGGEAVTVEATPEGAETAGLSGVNLAIAETIPGLMRFVESARGLAFEDPVAVRVLPDAAFREELAALQERDVDADERRQELQTTTRVLRALGLLEGDVDLDEATKSLLSAAVAGYYDTEEKELVVRGDDLTASVRVTLVHELTHALQDQHFDLDREELEDRDDEAEQSFSALIEGDAVRIEGKYLDSLPEAEQKAAEREEMEAAAGIDPTLPRVLMQLLAFPYAVGPGFAGALVDAGGQARLDAAFDEPPTTSEQILHPDRYVDDGEAPRSVTDPKPPESELDSGVLGELGLLLVLERLVEPADAVAAAGGWGGDRYVAWRDGDDTCVRTNLVMDTATDARELVRALEAASRARGRFDVSSSPEVVGFTACG